MAAKAARPRAKAVSKKLKQPRRRTQRPARRKPVSGKARRAVKRRVVARKAGVKCKGRKKTKCTKVDKEEEKRLAAWNKRKATRDRRTTRLTFPDAKRPGAPLVRRTKKRKPTKKRKASRAPAPKKAASSRRASKKAPKRRAATKKRSAPKRRAATKKRSAPKRRVKKSAPKRRKAVAKRRAATKTRRAAKKSAPRRVAKKKSAPKRRPVRRTRVTKKRRATKKPKAVRLPTPPRAIDPPTPPTQRKVEPEQSEEPESPKRKEDSSSEGEESSQEEPEESGDEDESVTVPPLNFDLTRLNETLDPIGGFRNEDRTDFNRTTLTLTEDFMEEAIPASTPDAGDEGTPKPTPAPPSRVPSFQELSAHWSAYRAKTESYKEKEEARAETLENADGSSRGATPSHDSHDCALPKSPGKQRSILRASGRRRLRHSRKRSLEGGSMSKAKRLRRSSWPAFKQDSPTPAMPPRAKPESSGKRRLRSRRSSSSATPADPPIADYSKASLQVECETEDEPASEGNPPVRTGIAALLPVLS